VPEISLSWGIEMHTRYHADNHGTSIALCVTLVVTLLVGAAMFASTQHIRHSFDFAPRMLVQ